MLKVCHLTSVHPRNDVRILHRECQSLAKEGYDTTLVVADGLGEQFINGVYIKDVGTPSNRFSRIFFTTWKVLEAGRKSNADVYHFHDPELFCVCALLSLSGKKVIFDIHENIIEQIKDKFWLPKVLRFFAAFLFQIFNKLATRLFAIVIAEHSYASIYSRWYSKYRVTTVLNYPKLDSLNTFKSFDRSGNEFFYIGGVSNQRGLDVILEACSLLDQREINFKVHFVGAVSDKNEINKYPNLKNKVVFYGRMDLLEGYIISQQCIAGLAVLKPLANFVESFPTKIFEYMSIGLPVISSNFELYKKVVIDNNAGVCVDPTSPTDIAEAMLLFINQQLDVKTLSKQGLKSAKEKYSWQSEEKKLLNLYDELLGYEH